MADERRILHLDLDAFFCAVEEQGNPDLHGKPFVVGGSPEERGVVASCSYAARTFGIRSAMPMSRALKLCPKLIIIHGHYKEYSKASRKVMSILREISPSFEQVSIDEAFIEITELPDSSKAIAHLLQARINQETGLPCSIGIASNKLVAKVATDYGKSIAGKKGSPPNAICIVPWGKEAEFLGPLPVDALWGIGPKTGARLVELGIETVADLAKTPEKELMIYFGKWGYELSKEARGIDDRPLATHHQVKSISQETTFVKDVRKQADLVKTLENLSKQVCSRLKRKHLEANTVKLKLRWSDFQTITRQKTLKQPSNQLEVILTNAQDLLDKSWKPGQPVRLIGVGTSGLSPEQMRLWDVPDIAKIEHDRRLSETIHDLRQKFGDQVVKWGTETNTEQED
jgi:DNA polymerase IV